MQYDRHPELAGELLRNIPRLEEVSLIIAGQSQGAAASRSHSVNRKSQILKLALAYDMQELVCESPMHALVELKDSGIECENELLNALGDFVKHEKKVRVQELEASKVKEGMVLADDLVNNNGMLLMSKGQQISASALRLLQNLLKNNSIAGTIKIVSSDVPCPAS